ncbi:unnamed protein product [Cladocopium goreaui]|uniref:Peptide methionine sulfoxide reductase B5 (AtMSRB5) (Peptide-methionine (R)-S-oxide reductase) n=1 Tax=Cladocopium goreaui TaxID=2562237 RepID=A0A9P1CCD9_9DINO|nr:unnamed protein product [Cladocopium goreaui]
MESKGFAIISPSSVRMRLWRVVGGCDSGGLVVRDGRDLESGAMEERLQHGATVEELQVVGSRLHYKKRSGNGPAMGWVSILAGGKRLLEEASEHDWPLLVQQEDLWALELSEEVYEVMRKKITEPRGKGKYNAFFPSYGHFRCAACATPLYSFQGKMKNGCGWAAFSRCLAMDFDESLASVVAQVDWVSGGREILCRSCGGHLGHVFMDGQCLGGDGPERHCVNSMALVYVEEETALNEVCCDLRRFHEQLRDHSNDGSYSGVMDASSIWQSPCKAMR